METAIIVLVTFHELVESLSLYNDDILPHCRIILNRKKSLEISTYFWWNSYRKNFKRTSQVLKRLYVEILTGCQGSLPVVFRFVG